MNWTVDGLEAEYLEAKRSTENAWAAFCIARAKLPIYQAFVVIKDTFKLQVSKDKIPTAKSKLYQDFHPIRQKLINEAYLLPEFKEFQRLREEEKEAHLVWIDAKMRYGGGGNGD